MTSGETILYICHFFHKRVSKKLRKRSNFVQNKNECVEEDFTCASKIAPQNSTDSWGLDKALKHGNKKGV